MDHTQNSNTREVQFSSVTQLCPTLCDPVDCSTPGLPVNHQLLEFTQTHVHWVSDAIQPSHPLSSPSPPAFNLSQHQGLCFEEGGVFSNESVLHIRWPEYWSFSFSISPSDLVLGSASPRRSSSIIHGPALTSGVHWCIWEGQSANLRDRVWERECLLSGWMLIAFAGQGCTLFVQLVLQVL